MRVAYRRTNTLGVIPIEKIEIDTKSRDDRPRILLALQKLWKNKRLRDRVLAILEKEIGDGIDQDVGRPGMSYWRIYVIGVLKQSLALLVAIVLHNLDRDVFRCFSPEFSDPHGWNVSVRESISLRIHKPCTHNICNESLSKKPGLSYGYDGTLVNPRDTEELG